MLYIDDRVEEISRDEVERFMALLPPWRLCQAKSFRHFSDIRLNVMAFGLLQKALAGEYGLSAVPEFAFDEHGKPFFPNLPGVCFNLSHCQGVVACGVSSQPVGVDVERIGRFNEELARYVSNDEEFERIMSSSAPEVEFMKLWTRKEAVVKMTGRGIEGKDELRRVLQRDATGYTLETIVNDTRGWVLSVANARAGAE